jgi:hypothetical protein
MVKLLEVVINKFWLKVLELARLNLLINLQPMTKNLAISFSSSYYKRITFLLKLQNRREKAKCMLITSKII